MPARPKRRSKRPVVPPGLAPRKLPRWGTKVEATQNERMRALKNRIAELEAMVRRLETDRIKAGGLPSTLELTGITKCQNDPNGMIDDLCARAVDVHFERMNARGFWMGITDRAGHLVHIDIWCESAPMRLQLFARVRT